MLLPKVQDGDLGNDGDYDDDGDSVYYYYPYNSTITTMSTLFRMLPVMLLLTNKSIRH